MNKKKCPQCKNIILITSPTCLYCGRPNKFITKEYVNKKWNKDNNENLLNYIFSNKYLLIILLLIFTIVIIQFMFAIALGMSSIEKITVAISASIFIIAFTWVSIKGDLRKLAKEQIEDNENNEDN